MASSVSTLVGRRESMIEMKLMLLRRKGIRVG